MVTTPARVGLPDIGPRRTPGLRREEVAVLAGVSTDYYIRLEQGRERRPSDQVVAALARALRLGSDAAAHLYELARPGPRRPAMSEDVGPGVMLLMDSWPYTPALVVGRRLDVLAINPFASALYCGLSKGDNLLKDTFLNPRAREFYRDWETIAYSRLAHVRAAVGAYLDDPRLAELVEELSEQSADFRRMWARHDVQAMHKETKRFRHSVAGDLTVCCHMFHVSSAPGQQLATIQAEPGSPSDRGLQVLAELAVRPGAPAAPARRPAGTGAADT